MPAMTSLMRKTAKLFINYALGPLVGAGQSRSVICRDSDRNFLFLFLRSWRVLAPGALLLVASVVGRARPSGSTSSQPAVQMSASRGASVVWAVFQIAEDDEDFAICNLCKARLSRGKKNHTTSPLWTHLRTKHHGRFQQLKKLEENAAKSSGPRQGTPDSTPLESESEEPLEVSQDTCVSPGSVCSDAPAATSSPAAVGEQGAIRKRRTGEPSVPAMFQRKQALKPGDKRAVTITKLIAEMICLDQQPLSLVEDVGFRRLVGFLESRYTMPSRKHIAEKVIPEMYAQQRARVVALLQRTDHVALTTDMWTSTSSDDYMSLTAHFVEREDFSFHHVCLECVPFKGISHTGAAISEFLKETIREWDLTEKVVCVVRDNGANMVSGLAHSGFIHVPCLAHTLQLVIKDGLLTRAEVNAALQACRAIVGHFKHSPKAMKVLRAVQARIQLPRHRLIQDEPTRWNSKLHMMRRLLEQKEAILLASAELNFPVPLSVTQWKLMEDMVQLLQTFHVATLRVSSASATVSEVLPIVNTVAHTLQEYSKSPRGSVTAVAKQLLDSLKARYQNLEKEEIYVLSTLLDPRFKQSVFVRKQAVEQGKARLLELMRGLTSSGEGGDEEGASQPSTSCTSPGPPGAPSQPTGAAGAEKEGLMMLHQIFQTFRPRSQEKTVVDVLLQDELDAYLKEANIPAEADILGYWHANWKFPNLRSLAQRYLVAPPSTVASERLFSTSGLIVDQKRSRLDPERVRMLVFLNRNLSR